MRRQPPGQPVEPVAAEEFDRSRDRRKHRPAPPRPARPAKAVGIFLGDEAGRQPPFAPARMAHQRRQERNIVLDAVDDELVERVRHRIDRLLSRVGAQVQSLAIIGS